MGKKTELYKLDNFLFWEGEKDMVGENFPEGFPHSSIFLNCFLFWPFYLKKKYKNCHLTAGVAMYEWKTLCGKSFYEHYFHV